MTTAGRPPSFAADRVITSLDVPVDEPDERALAIAVGLAEAWQLPIRLLHLPPPPSQDDHEEGGLDLDALIDDARRRWPGHPIEAIELEGDDVADAVVGAAEPGGLLVVSTDNANAWSFKDSVAERLVDRVVGPLVLVGREVGSTSADGGIVVAYDGRPAAESALDAAASLAAALDDRLWLVQVVAQPLAGDEEVGRSVGVRLHRRAAAFDRRLDARWEVIQSNDPVHAIAAFADRIDASFVVAAARGRADQTRTTMSSITMGLVAAVGRPVLVVHH